MCAFARMAARLSPGRLDADLRLPLPRQRRLRLRVTAPPKVGFVSLGCPKALVDSERILTQLRAEGYDVVAELRRRRPRRRQHLRLHRRRGATNRSTRSARRSRRTARSSSPAASARRPETITRAPSERARGHRAARLRRSDERGARAPAAAARSVHRPGAAAGHPAHAAALRVSQDLRGLQPPLQLLHHPVDARRPREPARSATCCARPRAW